MNVGFGEVYLREHLAWSDRMFCHGRNSKVLGNNYLQETYLLTFQKPTIKFGFRYKSIFTEPFTLLTLTAECKGKVHESP